MGNSMYHYWKSQPEVLRQILEQRKSQTEEFVKLFCAVNPDKLYLIGSGTSLNAERAAAGYMETILDVDVCAVPSSRIPQLRGERPMVVFISQGGLVHQHAAGDGTACRLPVHQHHGGGGM